MSFIRSRMAAVNNRRLGVAAVLAAIAGIISFFTLPTIVQAFSGPKMISDEELAAVSAPGWWDNYVNYRVAGRVIDTGIRYGKKNNPGTKYMLADADNRVLLISARMADQGPEFIGRIETISGKEKEVVQKLTGGDPAKADRLLPIMLQSVRSIWFDAIIALAFILAFGLPALWLGMRSFAAMAAPDSNPIMKVLAQQGDASEVCADIDEEVRHPNTMRIGRLILTPNWLVNVGFWSIEVARVSDVIWVYKRVVTGQGASISAVICLRDKREMLVTGSDEAVNRMLEAIVEQSPWLPAGYTEEMANIWRTQRDVFITEVDRMKQSYRSGSRPGAEGQEDY